MQVSYHFITIYNNRTILLIRSAFYWEKRHLKWALINDPVIMTRQSAISAVEAACNEWHRVSPFTFEQVLPSEKVCAEI